MRSDKERLIDIDTFLKKILSEYNQLKFDSDETFRYGLLKYLEIIGEASRTLREYTRQSSPKVEWQQIIGFRNIIVHQYHDLDWDEIKDIIENDLEPLLLEIESLILKNEK